MEFYPISLNEMDKVNFMRRTDIKYLFSVQLLPDLLKKIVPNYYMVEIEGKRPQKYETTYFDTVGHAMYISHHNGKPNRFKVRFRKYIYTNKEFLEIKKKDNKGETTKKRMLAQFNENISSINGGDDFLRKNVPFDALLLKPKLCNRFVRITLVNKDFSERITLDYDIAFNCYNNADSVSCSTLCVGEIKREHDTKNSPFAVALRDFKVNSKGFSKYCIGLAMLNPEVKKNRFRAKLRYLNKI